MAETTFDTFIDDLLVRVAAIQGAVSSAHGVITASPYYWEPVPDQEPFPVTRNRKAGTAYDNTQGHPVRRDTITVEMSLVAGPALAGYRNEYEQLLNQLYMPFVARFDKVPKLSDPTTGVALRYVKKAMIISDTGNIGFRFEDNGPLFFGTRFTLQVTCDFQVPRTA